MEDRVLPEQDFVSRRLGLERPLRGKIAGVPTVDKMRTTLLLSLVEGAGSASRKGPEKVLMIVGRCCLSFAERVSLSMVARTSLYKVM